MDSEEGRPTYRTFTEEQKQRLRDALITPQYQTNQTKRKKIQKRKEQMYKFTSLGGTSPVVRNLIFINLIVYIITMYAVPSSFNYLALFPLSTGQFGAWQTITHMFLHGGILHIALNMLVLWQFGNPLEKYVGTKNFLILYFVSGIMGGLLWMLFGTAAAVGASGAISGILGAYLFFAPDMKVLFFFFIPMKLKYAIYLFAGISLVFGIIAIFSTSTNGAMHLAHMAHLGGLIGGFLVGYYWKTKNILRVV